MAQPAGYPATIPAVTLRGPSSSLTSTALVWDDGDGFWTSGDGIAIFTPNPSGWMLHIDTPTGEQFNQSSDIPWDPTDCWDGEPALTAQDSLDQPISAAGYNFFGGFFAPIVERIRRNIMTVLATITVANGYHSTVSGVESAARIGNNTGDLLAIVEMGSEQVLGEDDQRGSLGQHTHVQEFLVFVHVHAPEGTVFDRKASIVASDIRRGIMADVTRGNFAELTHYGDLKLFTGENGSIAGIVIPFFVKYVTKLDNPYLI